jgi:hypothetical protein
MSSDDLISQAAAVMGRKGGKKTSHAKTEAVRKNAKLGGWPKGKKRVRRSKSQPVIERDEYEQW